MWGRAVTALVLLLAASCSTSSETTESEPVAPIAPRRLLLVGDSVMGEVAAALEAATEGRAEVHYVLTIGTANVQDDWWHVWPEVVREQRPDAIAVFVGPWEIDRPDLGSRAWRDWYGARLRRWLGLLRAGSAEVYWLRPLPVREAYWDDRLDVVDSEFRRFARADGNLVLLDPLGSRTYVERALNGERLRRTDGLHLCPAGAQLVAERLINAMGLETAPGWERGDWRSRPPAYSADECP